MVTESRTAALATASAGGQGFGANPEMSPRLFAELADYIHKTAGIRMPPEKRVMLQSRLQKRMRKLGHQSYASYLRYVFSAEGTRLELQSMIDVVTTNKTDFFREPYHFDYLVEQGLPALVSRFGPKLRFWSAPCSKGHEVYTLAMVLAEYAQRHRGFDFEILGSDLSGYAIDVARRAVYPHREIEPVPMPLRKKYLMRSKDADEQLVRIVPELRHHTCYQHMNFMDKQYHVGEKFHLIFCRNMLIYFDQETQQQVVNRLARHLHPGGLFLTGHAESLGRIDTPFVSLEPTIYQLPE